MIEVFKTNVQEEQKADIINLLNEAFPSLTVNFDLEDRDRIMRVNGNNIVCDEIKMVLSENDIFCELLN